MDLNKIYNENCLDTMARMPDNFIDLTVTSPPYDEMRNYGHDTKFMFHLICNELCRVLKQGGVIVWIVADQTKKGSETLTSFKQAYSFVENGLNLHDTMIWKKPNPVPTQSTRYQQEFEYMFVFSKGKPKTFNPIKAKSKCAGTKVKKHRATKSKHNYNNEGIYTVAETKMIGNVWEIANVKNDSKHPAIFPYELAEKHIISWSNEGDLVYDPFMGSGTTAVASIKEGRNYIGSEISSEYVKIAEKRISAEDSQLKLF
jgi:DNA modification methylase